MALRRRGRPPPGDGARYFMRAGVEKVRITGGEPLLRPEVPDLVRLLKQELRVHEVALTTNG